MSEPEAILHIEDDPLVTCAVARELKQLGLPAIAVPDCAAARALPGPFRVAIFDIDLPDGDGVALAEELLGDGRVQRALFYTATRSAEVLARAEKLGSVVTKGDALAPLLLALSAREERAPASGIEGAPTPKANAS